MSDHKPTTDRRNLLKGALAAGILAGVGPSVFGDEPRESSGGLTGAKPDLIRAENEKPGTRDWMLTKTRIDKKSKYRCPWIEGYVSRTSLRAGEKLAFMVSTNPVSAFTIDIYRMGYYGGEGGRLMQRLGSFPGAKQEDPEIGEERLRECKWPAATEITIPADWPSGVYLGKLTAEREGLQSYVIFIVRDVRPCDFLFQCSDSTWQAYNRWPNQWALYDDGKLKWYCGTGVKVSFDRPYAMYRDGFNNTEPTVGSGSFLVWEFPLAYWMEKQGYDVSYISNVDTHDDAAGLLRGKAFISVGHDEYWSREMYDNMLAAVGHGVSAAFLSGDTCWGVIPFLPNSAGVPHRIITRLGQFGEIDPRLMDENHFGKTKFMQAAPSEALLIGARNVHPVVGVGDWICSDEKHWIFAGTGMKNGDAIKDLVGFEWMGAPADIPGLKVVSTGPVTGHKDGGQYAATVYPGPKGNWVFNAATVWWSDGLSAPPGYKTPTAYGGAPAGPDDRVAKIMTNVFDRFRGVG